MRAKSGVLALAVVAVALAAECSVGRLLWSRTIQPMLPAKVLSHRDENRTLRAVRKAVAVTCYRTVYDRVCYDKVINCTRCVPETRTREGLLHRVQARLGDQDPRVHRVQAVLGNQDPRSLLHRMQARLGNQDSLLHRV